MNINHSFKSPNFDQRPNPNDVSVIVIHATNMLSATDAIARLCDPNVGVSSHYLIAKTGEIFELVNPKFRAFHAGVSSYKNRDKVNDFSIGIELDNAIYCYNGLDPFPDVQINSLNTLLQLLFKQYPMTINNVTSHSAIAPLRKYDPGPAFNWKKVNTF